MGEVISIGTLTEEQLGAMASDGVDVHERVDVATLGIVEPQYGEEFVTHLEPEEAALFVELHNITQDLEKRTRELFADTMVHMGDKVRSSDIGKPLHEVFEDGTIKPEFGDDAKGEEYFRLYQRRAYLHGILYYRIGERTNLHAWRLGVRKPGPGDDKLRVVKVERRW